MRAVAFAALLAGASSLGCSDESGGAAASTSGAPAGCKPGEWQRDDATCAAAGLPPDMPCPPGEWLRETDGECIPAGVPPDGCGAGFVHDGDRGCEPILPAAPCPPGLMAVPGDTECHEIAPCGSGTWGEIPVEPDTEYVDQTYPSADSDGSALKPWTTIGDAVALAANGAIVAIAAGSYVEDVVIQGRPLRLWGRCPSMVEMVGTGRFAAVAIYGDAAGTELRALAVRGTTAGVQVSGSTGVLVERVWLHDNTGRGVNVQSDLGPTSVTLRSCLLEKNDLFGVFVSASEVLVENTVVRQTRPDSAGLLGRGLEAKSAPTTGAPSTLTVRTSLLEENHDIAVSIIGSEAIVDGTVVRDTLPDGGGLFGRGVNVQGETNGRAPSKLTLRASVLEQSHDIGVFVIGSESLIESTVVRGTSPNGRGLAGQGVSATLDPATGAPATLTLRTSLVAGNHESGVHAFGSTLVLEASAVRGTSPNGMGLGGLGLGVERHPTTGTPSTATVAASLIEQNQEFGVFIAGSAALLENTVVRGTVSGSAGFFGRGVNAQSDPTGAPSNLTLRASLVEDSQEAALLVADSTAEVQACRIVGSAPNRNGAMGDGVVAWSPTAPTAVTITGTRIEQSARAATSTFGAHLAVEGCALACQAVDLIGADYGGFTFMLEDRGGNLCGCPDATSTCVAKGEGLEPPPPIGGLE